MGREKGKGGENKKGEETEDEVEEHFIAGP